MAPGDTGTMTFRFDELGTFDFRCDLHPNHMTGTLIVR
jgi:plastocyanin